MLSRKSASLGSVSRGITAISPCSMAYPTPTPSAPPARASSRLSVSNWPKIVAARRSHSTAHGQLLLPRHARAPAADWPH